MTNITIERHYWEEAAADKDVDLKYIADVDTEECLKALAPLGDVIQLSHIKILDLGCGVGRLAIPIANKFIDHQVIGVDISLGMLAIAEKRFTAKPRVFAGEEAHNFTAKLGDGRTIPIEDKTCMAAYSMLLFQHLDPETVERYFYEVARILKKGGIFRLQYVAGDYHGELDHNYETSEMLQWFKDAGFRTEPVDKGLVHPQWEWITGVKSE